MALQGQVLASGGLDVDPGPLRDHARRAPHSVGVDGHVDPGHRRPPLVGRGQGGEDLDRGRLAGSVGAQQTEHGPRTDAE